MGRGLRVKEEMGIHSTSKLVVYVTQCMKQRRVALSTQSVQRVAQLWDFLAILVKIWILLPPDCGTDIAMEREEC